MKNGGSCGEAHDLEIIKYRQNFIPKYSQLTQLTLIYIAEILITFRQMITMEGKPAFVLIFEIDIATVCFVIIPQGRGGIGTYGKSEKSLGISAVC